MWTLCKIWLFSFAFSFLQLASYRVEALDVELPPSWNYLAFEHLTPGSYMDPAALRSGVRIVVDCELSPALPQIEKVVSAFNNLAWAHLRFEIASSCGANWLADATGAIGTNGLWRAPSNWPGTQPTVRITFIDNAAGERTPPGHGAVTPPSDWTGLQATGAIWVWDEVLGAWRFPKASPFHANSLGIPTRAPRYAVLAIRKDDYRDGAGGPNGVGPDIILHELGHALGFTEHRARSGAQLSPGPAILSRLGGPTGSRGLRVFDSQQRIAFGGYEAQSLSQLYPPLPGTSLPARQWETLPLLPRPDIFQRDRRATPFSILRFEEINPEYLVYQSASRRYVDCRTGQPPVFTLQFAKLSPHVATPDEIARLRLLPQQGCPSGSSCGAVILSRPATAFTTSVRSEHQWRNFAIVSDEKLQAISSLPGEGGLPKKLTLRGDVVTEGGTVLSNGDVNSVVTLFAENTTDMRCRSAQLTGLQGGEHRGHAVATSKWRHPTAAPHAEQVVVSGAPFFSEQGLSKRGRAFVSSIDPQNGTQKTDIILPPGPGATPADWENAQFGSAVAVSDSGNLIAVGAPNFKGRGAIFLYQRNRLNGQLNYLQRLDPNVTSTNSNVKFGSAIALAGESLCHSGTRIFVGAPGEVGNGSVYAFAPTMNSGCSQTSAILAQTQKITGSYAGGAFGTSLAYGELSGPQEFRVLIGAPYAGPAAEGRAYLALFAASVPPQTQASVSSRCETQTSASALCYFSALKSNGTDVDPAMMSGAQFGASVAFERDEIVIGAPRAEVATVNGTLVRGGAVFTFARQIEIQWGGSFANYTLVNRIDLGMNTGLSPYVGNAAGRPDSRTQFGDSVALFRGTILVGAPGNGALGNSAYLYRTRVKGSVAPRLIQLPAAGNTGLAAFGHSVALGDRWLAVGAPRLTVSGEPNRGGLDVSVFRTLKY